jgi:ribosomal protein S18 acetylase RimI-like enzyme
VRAGFRPAQAGELEELLRWMAELYAHDTIPWDGERARVAAAALLASPEHGGIWFIVADEQVAGYFVLTIGFSLEFAGRYGLLDEFYLAEKWRGLGIGTQALEFAADRCRADGLSALRLEVGHDNPGALRLYQRAGFALHGRHLMTKWL